MVYVVMVTPASPVHPSRASAVNRAMLWSCMLVHSLNWWAHWSTDTWLVTRTSVDLRTRAAAVMPTSDLPAPHGSTTMPDRARPLPNILAMAFSW